MDSKIVDHLFRHQYGKMIAILTNVFGLSHIEEIEDAVQDTFVKATLQWRNKIPDNPEAWLITASKNRIIDLLRRIKAENVRFEKASSGSLNFQFNEFFLDQEVEDSQLRMIFVACHPALDPEEQIAFALKTISGFSMKEIAAALLLKDETIKKRLSRARKTIKDNKVEFVFPESQEVENRISGVLQVIYLIFNEGFHSTKPDQLISKDLCGEALRLCKLMLKKEKFRSGSLYALFALMCFHASRLESKVTSENEIIDLEHQDRSRWYMPLIILGNDALRKSMDFQDISAYHYEAAIAAEHIKAIRYENTNWDRILDLYDNLNEMHPSASNLLNMATIQLKQNRLVEAKKLLDAINPKELEQRLYLLHGCYAEYHYKNQDYEKALHSIETAISKTTNELERNYLIKKKNVYSK